MPQTMSAASVLLLTWNQASFVQEALLSLLCHDMDDLEIIVSDDASTDETWRVLCAVADAYVGSKQLRLRRSGANLGIVCRNTTDTERSCHLQSLAPSI